jgi:hypothetical protein
MLEARARALTTKPTRERRQHPWGVQTMPRWQVTSQALASAVPLFGDGLGGMGMGVRVAQRERRQKGIS